METRKNSLTDMAAGVMTQKSDKEIQAIRKEQIVRREGTLEHQITHMYAKKEESVEKPADPE